MLSANWLRVSSVPSPESLTKILNRTFPKTEPWGTPLISLWWESKTNCVENSMLFQYVLSSLSAVQYFWPLSYWAGKKFHTFLTSVVAEVAALLSCPSLQHLTRVENCGCTPGKHCCSHSLVSGCFLPVSIVVNVFIIYIHIQIYTRSKEIPSQTKRPGVKK